MIFIIIIFDLKCEMHHNCTGRNLYPFVYITCIRILYVRIQIYIFYMYNCPLLVLVEVYCQSHDVWGRQCYAVPEDRRKNGNLKKGDPVTGRDSKESEDIHTPGIDIGLGWRTGCGCHPQRTERVDEQVERVSGVLCDRKMNVKIKGKVYRTVVRPAHWH